MPDRCEKRGTAAPEGLRCIDHVETPEERGVHPSRRRTPCSAPDPCNGCMTREPRASCPPSGPLVPYRSWLGGEGRRAVRASRQISSRTPRRRRHQPAGTRGPGQRRRQGSGPPSRGSLRRPGSKTGSNAQRPSLDDRDAVPAAPSPGSARAAACRKPQIRDAALRRDHGVVQQRVAQAPGEVVKMFLVSRRAEPAGPDQRVTTERLPSIGKEDPATCCGSARRAGRRLPARCGTATLRSRVAQPRVPSTTQTPPRSGQFVRGSAKGAGQSSAAARVDDEVAAQLERLHRMRGPLHRATWRTSWRWSSSSAVILCL